MQFEEIDRRRRPARELPRRLRPEAVGIDSERILRLKSRPLHLRRPVAVAERMRLLSRRREVEEELRHLPVERLVEKREPRVPLDGEEERQIPFGVARRIERPLRPAAVASAVVREDRSVYLKCIIQIMFRLFTRNPSGQHHCDFSKVTGQPPGV
ncbi:hypothetical protein SDC9_175645 [bioreactor metagenome]|uniref:Uncharacterized protein n=1 Tax=bioreactor metagenome TaxID=1076179 RepID=A0A645GNA1_9ZZZZ